jgi:hypothetical protein
MVAIPVVPHVHVATGVDPASNHIQVKLTVEAFDKVDIVLQQLNLPQIGIVPIFGLDVIPKCYLGATANHTQVFLVAQVFDCTDPISHYLDFPLTLMPSRIVVNSHIGTIGYAVSCHGKIHATVHVSESVDAPVEATRCLGDVGGCKRSAPER